MVFLGHLQQKILGITNQSAIKYWFKGVPRGRPCSLSEPWVRDSLYICHHERVLIECRDSHRHATRVGEWRDKRSNIEIPIVGMCPPGNDVWGGGYALRGMTCGVWLCPLANDVWGLDVPSGEWCQLFEMYKCVMRHWYLSCRRSFVAGKNSLYII